MEKIVVSCLESRIDEDQSIYSRFLLGPFLSGHAVTVATALRRALLSEVKNIAITALHIQGVTHEFSTLVGVRESVLEVSLNFQQITLSTKTKSKSVQIGYLHVQGPAIVHANDLKLPDGIECVNPTQYIATLSTEGLLVVKFLIGEKKSFLKSNTSTLNSKKIKEAKVYSAQLSKALLNHAEYDPPRLFRLLRNQSLPNGGIVRKTIEAESTCQFVNLNRPNESVRSEAGVGPGGPKSLQPDLEQLSLALPLRSLSRSESASARSSSSPRITDSIFDQLANQTSDEFNSEVCLRTIIPLDPIFTPVYQVNFGVERDDLSNQIRERVIMEVWTNGSIHPRQAINEAALSTMSIFSKLRKTFQLDSHSLALSDNSTAPLATLIRGTRLHKTKNLTKGGVVNDDASESVEPLAALLSFANLQSRRTLTFGLPAVALSLRSLSLTFGSLSRSESAQSFAPRPRPLLGRERGSKAKLCKLRPKVSESTSEQKCATARVAEGSKKRINFRRFALTKPSETELDLTNSVRQKLNSFSSLGFVRSRRPVSFFLQNFGISHIRGQTFLLEQSFLLKAKFFKGRTFTPLFGQLEQTKRAAYQPSDPPAPALTFAKLCNGQTFKRTFLPSFKVVLGALSLSAYRPSHSRFAHFRSLSAAAERSSAHFLPPPPSGEGEKVSRKCAKVQVSKSSTSRNDVSARRKSLFSSYTQPNLKQNQAGLTKASLLFKLRFCLAGSQTFTTPLPPRGRGLQSEALHGRGRGQSHFHKAKVWPVGRKLSLCESEAFKPFLRGSWCSETSCLSPPRGGKGNRSKDRAIKQVSIGLGRLLLVLSKYEQKGEHRSRVHTSQTFALAKAVKAVALIRRAGISSLRSDLLSKKVSTSEKGGSTFILSKNRLSSRLSRVTSWPNFRPTGQTFAKRELLSLSVGRAKMNESVNGTDRIAQQSQTRQFASSVSLIKQLKPKPILFLIKYRTFSFTRNAVRIFISKQEDSLFLLPLAKQLIRVKLARVLTSYLPLISKRLEPSIPFSFTETKAFTTVDGSNGVDVKQVLLSLAALPASRENDVGVSQTDGRQVTGPTKEDHGTGQTSKKVSTRTLRRGSLQSFALQRLLRPRPHLHFRLQSFALQAKVRRASLCSPLRGRGLQSEALHGSGQSSAVLGRRRSNKVPKSLISKRPKKSGRRRPMGRVEGGLKDRAPQKRIASVIALHTITPLDRNVVPVSRFATSKLWFRSNLKKQFGFFQFACNGFRPAHQHDVVHNYRYKGVGRHRSGTCPRGLKKRWMPELGPALQRRDLERSGVCVNRTEALANLNRLGPVHSALLSAGTQKVRVACRLEKGREAKVLPVIMTKAPPLCFSSGLVNVLSSLNPTGRCSKNVPSANKSSANFCEARVRGNPTNGGSDRKTRVTGGGNRLSILYSSNLDKMSFLSSDLANLSLSLKTYTFLKKKGKNNIATLLEDSPNTLFSLLKGDENMFHEVERSLFFLGLPFKERS